MWLMNCVLCTHVFTLLAKRFNYPFNRNKRWANALREASEWIKPPGPMTAGVSPLLALCNLPCIVCYLSSLCLAFSY